jgi:hypothetical protein
MVMMRNDKRINTTPANPGKKLGDAVGEAAKEAAEAVGKIANDDLKLGTKGPSAKEMNDAFDRVEAAQKRMTATSVGTLGALPAFKKAQEDLAAARADLEQLRSQDPKLYDKVAGDREQAKEKAAKGFWSGLASVGLFIASPAIWVATKLFGGRD